MQLIEGIPEPVICITSGGWPAATINWLKLTPEGQTHLDLEENVEHQLSNNRLIITKSKVNVTVVRLESNWTLSCSAVNFNGSKAVMANNSKRFDVFCKYICLQINKTLFLLIL